MDVATGKWTALDAGVGGGIDSYFEYLVKGSVMLSNSELLEQFYGMCFICLPVKIYVYEFLFMASTYSQEIKHLTSTQLFTLHIQN